MIKIKGCNKVVISSITDEINIEIEDCEEVVISIEPEESDELKEAKLGIKEAEEEIEQLQNENEELHYELDGMLERVDSLKQLIHNKDVEITLLLKELEKDDQIP